MNRFSGNTPEKQKEMLEKIGLHELEDLFSHIPAGLRLEQELDLPPALSEPELMGYFQSLAGMNCDLQEYVCFLGGGAYDRYIPAAIHHIVSRQEFLTTYTPYQPEISQGTLQSIFEYQTMICQLSGMDVANASMYDGATALAEACASACNATRRSKVLISEAVNPQYRQTVNTYCRFNHIEVEVFPHQGASDWNVLAEMLDNTVAGVITAQPNYFGIIEDLAKGAELAHRVKALFIAVADPIALALLASPGSLGADIVVGDGQSLGNPLAFGGPHLGFFAVKEKYLRRMPGRVVGMTKDIEGRRGFVLTIQAREQHIRREKAVSNICSNQALCALTAAIYLALMGSAGLRKVARLSLSKAHYLHDKLLESGAFSPLFPGQAFLGEFALKSEEDIGSLNRRLFQYKLIGGLSLEKDYPSLGNSVLIAVTEKRSRAEMELFAGLAKGGNRG